MTSCNTAASIVRHKLNKSYACTGIRFLQSLCLAALSVLQYRVDLEVKTVDPLQDMYSPISFSPTFYLFSPLSSPTPLSLRPTVVEEAGGWWVVCQCVDQS